MLLQLIGKMAVKQCAVLHDGVEELVVATNLDLDAARVFPVSRMALVGLSREQESWSSGKLPTSSTQGRPSVRQA